MIHVSDITVVDDENDWKVYFMINGLLAMVPFGGTDGKERADKFAASLK